MRISCIHRKLHRSVWRGRWNSGHLAWVSFALFLWAWAAIEYFLLRPAHLATDWKGWRQVDTQSIALGFLEPGGDLFHPRVLWGGDGPGYVESELALYAYCVSFGLRLWGAREEVGQVFSLVLVG